MLSDNIRKYRKAKKFSQEDLAAQIYVVRQTLSKWENDLSVPDADQLIKLADALDVTVNDLLGTEIVNTDDLQEIALKLAEANAQIAEYAEENRRREEAGKIRGLLLWLTLISIVIMGVVKNEIVAISLASALLIAILVIFYRNITLLTITGDKTVKTGSIKAVTVFDIVVIILMAAFAILTKTGVLYLGDQKEEMFAAALITVVIIFTGLIAPKLPFNRHTGLRLPWIVQNEDAWNIAHRILGLISVPLGLLYLSLTFFVSNFEMLTLAVIIAWIGVPGLISLLYTMDPKGTMHR